MTNLFGDFANQLLDAGMVDGDLLRLLDDTYAYVTGGSYADQSITWATAVSGQKRPSADLVFAGMPAVTVAYYEIWDSTLTTTKYGGFLSEAEETADSTTDRIVGNSWTLTDGALILFSAAPDGLSAGTVYYVVNSTTDDFQLAATAGGTALDITADGPVHYGSPVAVGSGDTLTFPSSQLGVSLS